MKPYMIALYGSMARKEEDFDSDQDVLVIGDDDIQIPLPESNRLAISRYSWEELERMASYGSLFLWHLRLEAVPLAFNKTGFENFRRILEDLGNYEYVERDLSAFREAVADASEAIAAGDTSFEFELASLATIVRHASILGCYLLGSPEFGRYSAVSAFCRSRHLTPRIGIKFPIIYAYRMAIARNLPMPSTPTQADVSMWLEFASIVVEEVSKCSLKPCRSVG